MPDTAVADNCKLVLSSTSVTLPATSISTEISSVVVIAKSLATGGSFTASTTTVITPVAFEEFESVIV